MDCTICANETSRRRGASSRVGRSGRLSDGRATGALISAVCGGARCVNASRLLWPGVSPGPPRPLSRSRFVRGWLPTPDGGDSSLRRAEQNGGCCPCSARGASPDQRIPSGRRFTTTVCYAELVHFHERGQPVGTEGTRHRHLVRREGAQVAPVGGRWRTQIGRAEVAGGWGSAVEAATAVLRGRARPVPAVPTNAISTPVCNVTPAQAV